MSTLPERLRGWAIDAREGRKLVGADQDLREAARQLDLARKALKAICDINEKDLARYCAKADGLVLDALIAFDIATGAA